MTGYVLASEALPYIDGQALAREQTNHRQHAQLAPIEQRISDKVHTPDFIDGVRELFGLPALCGLVAPGALQSQRQAFLAAQAIHPQDASPHGPPDAASRAPGD